LFLRVLMQILCGLFAYTLLAEMGLRRATAILGGALYSLSPFFFLSPNAPIYPMPFLPLLLLGIECAAKAARARRRMGWSLVTVAVAYSILGGFPELAYLDGLFAGVWAAWRFTTLPRGLWLRFAGKLCLGVVVALGICAPLLMPFLEYLPIANLGPHGGGLLMQMRLGAALVPLQFFPFLYGPLNSEPPASIAAAFDGGWVRVPSWVTASVLMLAIASLWRRGVRPQPRYFLLFWIVLWEARYLGFEPATWFMNRVPELATADITRFSGPMLAFSVFVLASFGLDDYLEQGALSVRRLWGVVASVVAIISAAIIPVLGFVFSWWHQKPSDMHVACAVAVPAILVSLYLCRELKRPRHKYILLTLLVIGPFASSCIRNSVGSAVARSMWRRFVFCRPMPARKELPAWDRSISTFPRPMALHP